jgi:hypothetical protein
MNLALGFFFLWSYPGKNIFMQQLNDTVTRSATVVRGLKGLNLNSAPSKILTCPHFSYKSTVISNVKFSFESATFIFFIAFVGVLEI